MFYKKHFSDILPVPHISYCVVLASLLSELSGQERRIPTSRITHITDTFDISNTLDAEIPALKGHYLLDLSFIEDSFVELRLVDFLK